MKIVNWGEDGRLRTAGEIAKIGITSKPMVIGPSRIFARYTEPMLPRNISDITVRYVKNKLAARFLESTLLIKYAIANGKLPPMNTMFK